MTHPWIKKASATFIFAILFAHVSFAQEPVMGEPESFVKQASEKLLRGIVNTVTGVGEVIRQPIVCTCEDGAVGVPVGIINGLFMAVVRTGSGLLEVASFPIPLDDSLGFRSPLNPAYVWQRAD